MRKCRRASQVHVVTWTPTNLVETVSLTKLSSTPFSHDDLSKAGTSPSNHQILTPSKQVRTLEENNYSSSDDRSSFC